MNDPEFRRIKEVSLEGSPVTIGVSVAHAEGGGKSAWPLVFDIQYSQALEEEKPNESVKFWRRTSDNGRIPEEEMDEWVETTVDSFRHLISSETRVLEIGCGNGLIFSAIIGEVGSYTGLDPAPNALEAIRKSEPFRQFEDKVTLQLGNAHELAELVTGEFDLIIVNSVAQYFDGLSYMAELIDALEGFAGTECVIFFGDIRSLELQERFFETVAQQRVKDSSRSYDEIKAELIARERETVYSPLFFEFAPYLFNWVDYSYSEIRKGNYNNEMSKFRYNAFLVRSGEAIQEQGFEFVKIDDNHSERTVPSALETEGGGNGLYGIQNPRFSENNRRMDSFLSEMQFCSDGSLGNVVMFDPFAPGDLVVYPRKMIGQREKLIRHPGFRDWLTQISQKDGLAPLTDGEGVLGKVLELGEFICNR